MIRETHRVPEGVEDVRLSDYLRTAFPALPSRKAASKILKRGAIKRDGKIAHSGDWVTAGQILEWIELPLPTPKTYHLPLKILFEDDELAVIHKPAGIEVSGNKFKTIENALAGNLTKSPRSDALAWPRPVHRLDFSTSGVLLIAKTTHVQVFLGQQFEARSIQKRYCAIVSGALNGEGVVEIPINGMAAQSEYRAIKIVPSLRSGHLTQVELSPVTGRTHQLRIHMAALGHPIVGDQKYGQPGNVLKGKGLFLAAVELQFPHPTHGAMQTVSIDVPHKFTALLKREQMRWIQHFPEDCPA